MIATRDACGKVLSELERENGWFVVPDADLVPRPAQDAGAIVTAEEHSVIAGLGGAVCVALCKSCPPPVERFGREDVFGQSGTAEELPVHYGPMPAPLVEAAGRVMRRK